MKIMIRPGTARGRIAAPPSKSDAHRLLIAAGLSEGVSRIRRIAPSEDILATLDALRAFGAEVREEKDALLIRGTDPVKASPGEIRCRESGTTLRLFAPLAMLSGKEVLFTGSEKLFSRPLSVYEKLAEEKGLGFRRGKGRLLVSGPLPPGEYGFPGNISSQFASGLLFALPHPAGESRITLFPPVESRPYIAMTRATLARSGVRILPEGENSFRIPGGQRFSPLDASPEGDWSNAAFLEGLNLLGGEVTLDGLREESLQGDKIFRRHFESLKRGDPEIDLSDCPDLGPVLMALSAALSGATFRHTERLKLKESDRGEAMREELSRFGIPVLIEDGAIRVIAAPLQKPRRSLSGHNDHRVVMALSLLLTLTGGEIEGAEAVNKSFPDYFKTLRRLGIEVEER